MVTPVHILLALTKGAMDSYKTGTGATTGHDITKRQVETIAGSLEGQGFLVKGIETVPLGADGLHRERRQYNSRALLKMARDRATKLTDWHVKVLLLTDADIYDTDTIFIAGQAEVGGRAAVVSFARLGARDEERFLKRVLKETLHELGHTLGLGHCREHDCVMYMSRVLAESDVKDHDFCKRCRTKAGRAI